MHEQGKLLFFAVASVAQTIQPFVCGGAAAITASVAIHPIDLTKVRLQLVASEGGKRPSGIKVATDIFRNEGFRALYAGLSASVMRQAVYGTARLGMYRSLSNHLKGDDAILPVHLKIMASLSTGAIASMIGNPFDVALVRMQADGLKPAAERRGYKGVFNAIVRIAREEGVPRLWRGVAPTVLRAMAMNCGQLVAYDVGREEGEKFFGKGTLSSRVAASLFAGLSCSFTSLPFDLIKSRLQNMNKLPSGEYPYTGVVDCFKKLVAEDGFLSLWRGFGSYYFRCAPHAIVVLLTLDSYNKFYSNAFGTEFKQ